MAYTGYEDLPSRVINYRIVPRLRKYYRADGTYDLFDINKLQPNCLHYLVNKKEASIYCARGFGGYDYGVYTINNNTSDFHTIRLSHSISLRHQGAAESRSAFKLKLSNSAGLYPYIVTLTNWSEQHNGEGYITLVRANGSAVNIAGGGGDRTTSWTVPINNATSMPDWKDYSAIEGHAQGGDYSSLANASSSITLQFIHRYTDEHPLYRYYR